MSVELLSKCAGKFTTDLTNAPTTHYSELKYEHYHDILPGCGARMDKASSSGEVRALASPPLRLNYLNGMLK